MEAVPAYLGWNAAEVKLGASAMGHSAEVIVGTPREHGPIRDCSIARDTRAVGILARDPTRNREVLALCTPEAPWRIVVAGEDLLHHTMNDLSTLVCYTRPRERAGRVQLWLRAIADDGPPEPLTDTNVGYDCQPVWHSDQEHLIYHTPDGSIETIRVDGSGREQLHPGRFPAIAPDGERIAFLYQDDLWVGPVGGTPERMPVRDGLIRRPLKDGVSWSADGRWVSVGMGAGLVGKRTDFLLVDPVTGAVERSTLKYLSALRLLSPSFAEDWINRAKNGS